MNIYNKIDIVCEKIEKIHDELMSAHELFNEQGLPQETQFERYLEIERLNKSIEFLKEVKKDLFVEANLDLD